MNRVFVSYSRRNKAITERIARDLSDAGMEVWVDWRQIHAGEFWQEEIFRGIERSDILVIVLSPDAAKSEWVQREVMTARNQGKVIIPVMAVNAYDEIQASENLSWILDIHFINFEGRYEEGFQELLSALPGKRRVSVFDKIDAENIPNPFKGLEAFQQTDAHFFFGREALIEKSLQRLKQDRATRFLAVVGASGSGKSSLVRAGVIPALRTGKLPGSSQWRIVIFTPGEAPVDAMAQRLTPLLPNADYSELNRSLHQSPDQFQNTINLTLEGAAPEARLLLVIDQFEEVFTRAGENERELFLRLMHDAVTRPNGRAIVLITMRADFFDRLSRYPKLAELFEQENMVIVAEMTSSELLRSIEGPARAVGLNYDDGLAQRILEDVRKQPGSLPLLQYALMELYKRRDGNFLTMEAYQAIGGVQRALAQHAEDIYRRLSAAQQGLMRRVLLRLIEVSSTGEATRRRVARADLNFRDVSDEAVQEILDLLTSAESRLLIASRQIKASDDQTAPTVWIEIGHEALIREWDRFTTWVAENSESLRYGSEMLQSAQNWSKSNRDVAYLLTGNRLVRSQVWIETADATALQQEYIQASVAENSRREAQRQAQIERELTLQQRAAATLRRFVLLLVVSLVVAIVLVLFSLNSLNAATESRNLAISARSTAEINEEKALSLALAASADRALGDNNNELALMLAVAANEIEVPPPQSQRVLAEVAYSTGTRSILNSNNGAVSASAFSPDGQTGISAAGNIVYLWDLNTNNLIRQFGADATGHTNTVKAVAFSPDGARIASAGADDTVILWDVASGSILYRLTGHTDDILSIDFSPNGLILASAGVDRTIILWDVLNGIELRRMTGHANNINSMDFSLDGTYLLSGSDDGTARRWLVATGAFVNLVTVPTQDGSTVRFLSVAFDPGSPSRAVSGNSDSNAYLWNISSASGQDQLIRTYGGDAGHSGDVMGVAFSRDGSVLFSASRDNLIIQWETSTAQVMNYFEGHDNAVLDIDVDSDGTHLLSASADSTVRLWDVRRAEEISRLEGHSGTQVVAVYGPGDLTILSGGSDNRLRLWDTETGLTIQEFRGHTARISDVDMSQDGKTALSASRDGSVILWDVATGNPIHTMRDHGTAVLAVKYLPDGQRAVSGATDGDMILWDLKTGQALQRYEAAQGKDDPGHLGAVQAISVSPDGRRLLSASADTTLILWDLETGGVVTKLEGHNTDVFSVAFDPTGQRAVSGASNGLVILWDTDENSATFGQPLATFEGHDRAVFGVQFSSNGQRIISGGLDSTLRVWDIASGFELRRYETNIDSRAQVRSVDFSQDGNKVVTGMTDATIREWRVLTGLNDLLAWTFANRFVAEPTCAERELFNLSPSCDAQNTVPTRTPFQLPTATPAPQVTRLTVGQNAVVNTDAPIGTNTRPNRLVVRSEPNPIGEANVLDRLDDGATVALLEGPLDTNGFRWWRVRTASETEGWVVESVPADNLQTLVPIPAYQ